MSENIRFGILTVSDRSAKGEREDASGPALIEAVRELGWEITSNSIVEDDEEAIKKILISWTGRKEVDVILTTGGTGFSPRDVTPEATRSVIEREAPGLSEVMRAESLRVTPFAMLSRAVAGIRGDCLIVNLPGSPKGAVENFHTVASVLLHAVNIIKSRVGKEGH